MKTKRIISLVVTVIMLATALSGCSAGKGSGGNSGGGFGDITVGGSSGPASTTDPTNKPDNSADPPATSVPPATSESSNNSGTTAQPTDPPSNNLNTVEQTLVGAYSYGRVPDGFYSAWKSSGTVDYEKWSSSLPLDMRIYVFNADGTFSSIEYYYSGNQNAFAFNKLIYTRATWKVTSEGVIQFTSTKETVEDFMAQSQSYKDKSIKDRNEYYLQDTYNGKKGIRVDSYSLEDIKEADFYEKAE